MERIKEAIEWIRGPEATIELRQNENLSLPFFKKMDETGSFVIFSFSGRKSDGENAQERPFPSVLKIYEISLEEHAVISEQDPESINWKSDLDILHPCKDDLKVDYLSLYDNIVKLTDRIIDGEASAEVYNEYADLFNFYNSARFRNVYYTLGQEFFKFIEDHRN